MVIPIAQPFPVAIQNPAILRISAVLLGAGAWDAAPLEFSVTNFNKFTLQFTYTRGAVGGIFDYQIQTSIYSVAALVPAGAGEWGDEVIYGAGPVVVAADTPSVIATEFQRYGSQGAAAETRSVGPMDLAEGIERLRIRARENGVVGTPGTLQLTGLFTG